MGAKITIDSATLMNKGLEVVEARWLFDIPGVSNRCLDPSGEHHPFSGRIRGPFDDRTVGIAGYADADFLCDALSRPAATGFAVAGLTEMGQLTFCKPDHDRFPCLRLGYESLRIGGTMPAAMNAANEIAVEAFLQGGIRFTDISDIIHSTMEAHAPLEVQSVEDALEADRWAREKADSLVHALAR